MNLCKSWVEVNLRAIAHNLQEIRNKVGWGVKVLAVVKSDAYGHGAEAVALLLERCGVEMLGVASVEEGAILRQRGIRLPIIVLGCIFPEEVEDFFTYTLTPSLCDLALARKFSQQAIKRGQLLKVHIKVDTGMGGLGVKAQGASKFIWEMTELHGLFVEGIFTHFVSSNDNRSDYTYEQLRLFKKVIMELELMGIYVPIKHAANSGAVLNFPEAYFNVVRPGLLLYGLTPPGCLESSMRLKLAMSFKTKLAFVKTLEPGETVSYGRSYTAPSHTKIGVLPIGYSSGYNLGLSNKSCVVIRGKNFPVVGRIRMNLIHVDLGQDEGVEIGDTVTLFGEDGPSVKDMALVMGGSPYELLCAMGRPNHRVYLAEAKSEVMEHTSIAREAQPETLHAVAH